MNGISAYEIHCDVKICRKDDVESVCNQVYAPCSDNKEVLENYLCDGFLCEKNEHCIQKNSKPECVPQCDPGYRVFIRV